MPPLIINHDQPVSRDLFARGLRLYRPELRTALSVDDPTFDDFRSLLDCEPAYAPIQDSLIKHPLEMDFGIALPGERVRKTIVFTASGDFSVKDIALSGPDSALFTYSNHCDTSTSQRTCFVDITYAPEGEGAHQAVFSMETQEETLQVPLYGTGALTLSPELSTTPGAIDFGMLNPGASAEQVITVYNSGGVATAIRDIAIQGPGAGSFRQSHHCFFLGAGEQCNLRVTADASEDDFAEAYLRVVPEHTDAASVSIPLWASVQSEQCLPVGWDVTGTTELNLSAELSGNFSATRNCDERTFTGSLELDPTQTTIPLLGGLFTSWLGTAHLQFEPAGDLRGTLSSENGLSGSSELHLRLFPVD